MVAFSGSQTRSLVSLQLPALKMGMRKKRSLMRRMKKKMKRMKKKMKGMKKKMKGMKRETKKMTMMRTAVKLEDKKVKMKSSPILRTLACSSHHQIVIWICF